MVEFSPNEPFVIGILADVSGSMRGAIGSSGTGAINRLEAFSTALEDLIKRAAESVRELPNPVEARLFAYGFGFGNALSVLLGRSGPNVRDLFSRNGNGERTVDVLHLADNWDAHLANVRSMVVDMFGATPMREAFEIARRRLDDEKSRGQIRSVLFVLSDGEPTDGDRTNILPIAEAIRNGGTTIISCFVTSTDITEPQRLYGQHQDDWPEAAKLMFDCASDLQGGTSFDANLHEYGWQLDPGAKLFAQVNQSEMLSQFLKVVLSPLKDAGTEDHLIGESTRPNINVVSPSPRAPIPAIPPPPSIRTSKAQILFLHGLGGRAESTWGRFPEFLMADREMTERFSIGFYSFPTSLFRFPFSARAPKIQELAAGLRTQIENDEFERINLVCHSLGGLVARRYLIEEVKASRPLRVEHLALFAVPNNGAGLASVAQFVSWRQTQIRQLCKDADIIEFLNEDWFQFEVQRKVKTKFVVGTQDEVVDRRSVAGYWGNPDVETIVGRGHINIVKPERADDLAVRILQRFLLN